VFEALAGMAARRRDAAGAERWGRREDDRRPSEATCGQAFSRVNWQMSV